VIDGVGNISGSKISPPPPGVDIIVPWFRNGKRPGCSILTGIYLLVVVMRIAIVLPSNLGPFLPRILRRTGGKSSISVVDDELVRRRWCGFRSPIYLIPRYHPRIIQKT
jgi:hypothetical protein